MESSEDHQEESTFSQKDIFGVFCCERGWSQRCVHVRMENFGRFESLTWKQRYGGILYERIQPLFERTHFPLRRTERKIRVSLFGRL